MKPINRHEELCFISNRHPGFTDEHGNYTHVEDVDIVVGVSVFRDQVVTSLVLTMKLLKRLLTKLPLLLRRVTCTGYQTDRQIPRTGQEIAKSVRSIVIKHEIQPVGIIITPQHVVAKIDLKLTLS